MSADPVLRALGTCPGPVASVYLQTPGDEVPAAQHAAARWRALRADLLEQGAPEPVLLAIDPLVADAHLDGRGLAVVAGDDGLRHVEHLPEEPPDNHAWWEPLPALLPLIERRQSEPPYVLVLTDRRGADIDASGHGEETVEPADDAPIRKVAAGGWSQRRYQQRAENTWETHAREIAEHVRDVADDVRAEIILVGGDVRAVQLLVAHLPDRLHPLLAEIPGGRAADGSEDETAAAIRRWVRTAAARRVVAALEEFREEIGQRDRAVEGVGPTRRALTVGQVATLLVHDDWLDDRCVPLDDDDHSPVRVIDVAIRDALLTDADTVVVPRHGGPRDGIGALLRWPADATTSLR
jgi:8-oxo-dGTP pyrophosphatase MutT (NUDIX family)